jgi:hypothetical protein
MKAARLTILVALAVSACERETPPPVANDASAPGLSGPAMVTVTGAPRFRAASGVIGGARGDAADATAEVAQSAAPPAAPGLGDPLQGMTAAATAAPMMVIRTGQAFIEVQTVDPAILKIRQLAAQVGGYITNSSVSGGKDQMRQATIEIKIPSPKYDEAVGSLSNIGKVETVSSQAQDVGEEFVDVTARVTNARRLEERLINLLANRTGKLDEVLRVERELARVREEIERYEGRLRYLGARVAMSTLTITVHEPAPILGNNPGENPIATALRRAWRNFVALVAGFIASLGILIPLGLIAFAAWVLYSRWKRTKP